MRNKTLPEGTILVDRWYSSCNNCGRQVLPESKTHEDVSGYSRDGEGQGCGVLFTHISDEYYGANEEIIRSMRPDLEYV